MHPLYSFVLELPINIVIFVCIYGLMEEKTSTALAQTSQSGRVGFVCSLDMIMVVLYSEDKGFKQCVSIFFNRHSHSILLFVSDFQHSPRTNTNYRSHSLYCS